MISSLNFKQFDKGSIRGFFDLRYHGMTIKGCRLMTGNNGLWVALPQKEAEQNGERKWFDQMYLTPPEADHVRRLVIADLEAQGHIKQPSNGRTENQRRTFRTPEGENLDAYVSDPHDDIPF